MLKSFNILGAGALGLSIYTHLNKTKHKCLITKNNKQITATTLVKSNNVKTKISPNYYKNKEINDFLFICTKTYDALSAIIEHKHNININCLIVLCQNGAPDIQKIQQILPKNNLAIASCLFGAKINNTELLISNNPNITLSPITNNAHTQTKHLYSYLKNNNIIANFDINTNKVIYEKLIINSTLNALGAIYKKSHQEIFKSRKLKDIAKKLCFESTEIINKKTPIASAEKMWQNINDLVKLIGSNHSSMLQDLINNKPTEIDAINGHIINLADQYNLSSKMNKKILTQIKEMYAN